MNVVEYLESKRIPFTLLQRPSGTQAITRCPVCGEDDFAINIKTGAFKCVHEKKCGISGTLRDLYKYYGQPKEVYVISPYAPKAKAITVTYEKPNRHVGEFLQSRGMVRDVYRAFHDILGVDGEYIVFLYKNDTEIVGAKYRSMKEKKFFQAKGSAPMLYNAQMCKDQEDLFIVEGELDVIAAYHYEIKAVSVPSGANNLQWIDYNWEYLQPYKRIFLMFDNDEAGQKNITTIAQRLGKYRCFIVTLPYKDMNECLMKGVTQEEIIHCILTARGFEHVSVKPVEYYIESLESFIGKKDEVNGIPTAFESLTKILGGYRSGEVTIVTGLNGSGKSTLLLQQAYQLAINGYGCLVGSFEMSPLRYLRWMVKMATGREDADAVRSALTAVSGRLYCINKTGYIETELLYEIIEYAAMRYGVQAVIIDSLMRVKMKTKDRYEEQSEFMTELCELADTHKIHIFLVAHPRKGESDIEEPDKVDVAGSMDLTNNAHNVIVVYRIDKELHNYKKTKLLPETDCVIAVKKNREMGKHGRIELVFDDVRKRFDEAL